MRAAGERRCPPGLAAVLIVCLVDCRPATTGPARLVPASGAAAGASATAAGITVTARQLDGEETAVFLRRRGYAGLVAPLAGLPVLRFWMRVENGSQDDMLLEPRFITLTDGRMMYLTPADYTLIYGALPPGQERDTVLADLPAVTFDRPLTIRPGETVERLVLFSRPEKMAGRVVLILSGLYTGQDTGGMALEFIRVEGE